MGLSAYRCSLYLMLPNRRKTHGIGKIYGPEKNITTYNLARSASAPTAVFTAK